MHLGHALRQESVEAIGDPEGQPGAGPNRESRKQDPDLRAWGSPPPIAAAGGLPPAAGGEQSEDVRLLTV